MQAVARQGPDRIHARTARKGDLNNTCGLIDMRDAVAENGLDFPSIRPKMDAARSPRGRLT